MHLQRAVSLDPESIEAHIALGLLHANNGEPEKAAIFYRKAIVLDPQSGDANYGLSSLQITTNRSADAERMEIALRSTDLSDANRVLIGYALGRAYEGLGKYDQAFAVVHAANRCQRKSIFYSRDEQKAMFERHKNALDQCFIDHCRSCCINDETPILVLGMPRSGTSLVEQILASHPEVHGAGEVEHTRRFAEDVSKLTGKPFPQNIASLAPQKLRDLGLEYIKSLRQNAGTALRVVDKLPHNFLRIGLFAALMPNAKIILCDRDPLDNCMSIYQHHFHEGHGYAANLTELGQYYNLYRDMISFWTELLPGHIYRLSYENLVAHTEEQVKALLQYCRLSFHADCLSFHKTARFVSSPSATQVRKPMYRASIGKGGNYDQHLRPLIEALAQ